MNSSADHYRWTRSKDGVLAGVCAGVADALGLAPWIIRVIWIVSILWFGSGLLLYLILASCLPRVDRIEQSLHRKLLGVCARIALRYRLEVGLVRVAFVLFSLVTFGAAILVYGSLYFLIPDHQQN